MTKYICPLCGKRFTIERATCDRCQGRVWLKAAYLEWERLVQDGDDTAPPASTPPDDIVTIIIPPSDD